MKPLLELAPGKFAHPGGALWLPEPRAVLVADVHLGYGWAQRRRGELGPVIDGGARDRLLALLDELNPVRVVFLGDLVHAPKPGAEERAIVEDAVNTLASRTQLTVVPGNHDRGFAADFRGLPLEQTTVWKHAGVAAVHGDAPGEAPPAPCLVLGHLHPAYTVHDAAGAGRKLPAFLRSRRAIVLPAFTPFSPGFDVARGLPNGLRAVLGHGPIRVAVTTGARVVWIRSL